MSLALDLFPELQGHLTTPCSPPLIPSQTFGPLIPCSACASSSASPPQLSGNSANKLLHPKPSNVLPRRAKALLLPLGYILEEGEAKEGSQQIRLFEIAQWLSTRGDFCPQETFSNPEQPVLNPGVRAPSWTALRQDSRTPKSCSSTDVASFQVCGQLQRDYLSLLGLQLYIYRLANGFQGALKTPTRNCMQNCVRQICVYLGKVFNRFSKGLGDATKITNLFKLTSHFFDVFCVGF